MTLKKHWNVSPVRNGSTCSRAGFSLSSLTLPAVLAREPQHEFAEAAVAGTLGRRPS